MRIKKWPPWKNGSFVALVFLLFIVIIDFIFTCDLGSKAEFCGVYTVIATSPVFIFVQGNIYAWIFASIILYAVGYIVGKILKKR